MNWIINFLLDRDIIFYCDECDKYRKRDQKEYQRLCKRCFYSKCHICDLQDCNEYMDHDECIVWHDECASELMTYADQN